MCVQLQPRKFMPSHRSKPDFIIIGVQKGGTTSLFKYLSQHPGVAVPEHKELHYFDVNYLQGIDWYQQFFPLEAQRHGRLVGEASPYYIFHPLAAKRIQRDLPNVKLIALLRDPIARAYSNFQMQLRNKNEKDTTVFEEAIALEPARIAGEHEKILADESYNSYNHRKLSYLHRGLYYPQIKQWQDTFGKDALLVLKSEDFFDSTLVEFHKVCDFLGISRFTPPDLTPSNQHDYPDLKPETVRQLRQFFQEDGDKLAGLLGDHFRWW